MKAAYLLKLIAQVSLLYCFCLITSYFIRSPVKELCHLLAFYFEKGIELSGGGRGRGNSRKSYTGRVCPDVQTLTILYIIWQNR